VLSEQRFQYIHCTYSLVVMAMMIPAERLVQRCSFPR
jgi:hypothetical protein